MTQNDPSTYFRFLPDIYQRADTGPDPDFLNGFLKVFEKIFSGIEDGTLRGRKGLGELLDPEVIGEFFYPRFSFLFSKDNQQFLPPLVDHDPPQGTAPPLVAFNGYVGLPASDNAPARWFSPWLDDFLHWLASWLDLLLEQQWSLAKKRLVIAKILPLYRIRGTARGLKGLLALLLNHNTDADDDLDNLFHAVKVSDGGLFYPNPSARALPTPINPISLGEQGYPLLASYQPRAPLLGAGRPWFFQIILVLLNYKNPTMNPQISRVQAILPKIRALVDANKPAGSNYRIVFYPTMSLGSHTSLGDNTILGAVPPSNP